VSRFIKKILLSTALAAVVLYGCETFAANHSSKAQKNHNLKSGEVVIDFNEYEVGTLPGGFTTAVTNGGEPGQWMIVDANEKKVLAQTDTAQINSRFPLCVYDKISVKDVAVAVDFMAISGKLDQAAGLVVRYKDKDNYYITRANGLEDNIRLYRVESGKRIQIAEAKLRAPAGQWHNLRLAVCGTNLKVFYDGKPIIDANDSTFADAGKVGLWTKADSVTYFADLKIEPKKK